MPEQTKSSWWTTPASSDLLSHTAFLSNMFHMALEVKKAQERAAAEVTSKRATAEWNLTITSKRPEYMVCKANASRFKSYA